MKAALKYVGKSRYTLEDLKEIITILRAPDGCPWDREQDHKSIRRDFLEECYDRVLCARKCVGVHCDTAYCRRENRFLFHF